LGYNRFTSNAPPSHGTVQGKNQRYCARGDSVTTEHPNEWQKWYQAALLELDPMKLPERIEQAYRAIHMHMDVAGPNCSAAERQAFADALANLRVLRREVRLPMDDATATQEQV
jgi:hypothetical protein